MKKLLFVMLLIPVQMLFAQDGLTPLDIAKIEYVSSAVINEAGTKIAYTVVVQADPLKENSSASLKLWLYDVAGKTSIPFITQGSLRDVHFRPNHTTITFLARRDGDSGTSLYEIPLAGGEASKIFEHNTSISSYEWSPDGDKIVFLAKNQKTKICFAL
jgi:dipeptidyl aminopeptidase/acylaminoacyl peptidase